MIQIPSFIPQKKHRAATLKSVAERDDATAFFESTHRILKTLKELQAVLDAERTVYVGRELTKAHETHYRGSISEVIAKLEKGSTKGEFTVIIGPKT